MVDEFLTPDRIELIMQACAQLCTLLDNLPEEMDASDGDAMASLRHAGVRGLELARAAVAALEDEAVSVDALRKVIDAGSPQVSE